MQEVSKNSRLISTSWTKFLMWIGGHLNFKTVHFNLKFWANQDPIKKFWQYKAMNGIEAHTMFLKRIHAISQQ